jgi:hypothetical protein
MWLKLKRKKPVLKATRKKVIKPIKLCPKENPSKRGIKMEV